LELNIADNCNQFGEREKCDITLYRGGVILQTGTSNPAYNNFYIESNPLPFYSKQARKLEKQWINNPST